MNTKIFAGALAALMTTTALGAHAAGEVEYATVKYDGGITTHVTLGITNGANTPNTAVVGPLSNTMTLEMDGRVKCDQDKDVNFVGSEIMFGAASVANHAVVKTNVLYFHDFEPAIIEWAGQFNGGWITEAGGDQDFVVPLNAVKAGNPLVRFDPVEEFNKKMQAFINNGGTKFDFMTNDQSFSVPKTISMFGACQKTKSGQFPTGDVKVGQFTVNIRVKYNGNPNLKGDVNPIIAQAQPQGGFQAGYNPLKITEGEIIAFVPNYVGPCPADPKFRVTLKGGGEGQVRIRILAGNSTEHESPVLDFENGELIYDFTSHLNYFGQASLNNKISRGFKLEVATKDKSKPAFRAGGFKRYDEVSWSSTCTPKLAVGTGGQGGIQAGGGAQQNPSSGQILQKQPVKPTPGFQVRPVNPDPTPVPPLRLAPQQTDPRPQRAQ